MRRMGGMTMQNFIFISPNFPENYWRFCRALKKNGLRVLGIGDQPWDELAPEVKENLHEYYLVPTLEDYDAVYRAVAFFISKYGRIDWLESNNEYWLEKDAALRTDFNIANGWHAADMEHVKFKSAMKEYYRRAGIPVARYHIVDDYDGCMKFIQEAGFPVIVKPDNGVGASHTYKLQNEEELKAFLTDRDPAVRYIMEEFITAVINSYDAIIDSNGNPVFETGNVTPESIMDIVNNDGNTFFYIVKNLAEDVRKAGRAAVKSFGVKSRFIHFEFFRLSEDQHIGKKGDVTALEVNMRPSGGVSPDMMNYANSVDTYQIWADMIAFDRSVQEPGEHAFCAYIGRRNGKPFVFSNDELASKYASQMRMMARIPEALSGAMGNYAFLAVFPTEEEMERFHRDAVRCRDDIGTETSS